MAESSTVSTKGKEIAARLAGLRELAETDPDRARADAWAWFKELGDAHDEESLDELFALGVAKPIEGPTDGVLVAFLVNPVVDKVVMTALGNGSALMPWMGKTFDPETSTGANRFKPWFEPVARVVFPRYTGHKTEGSEHLSFDMQNGFITDPLDPSHEVYKIEYKNRGYESKEDMGNPVFVRDILDCAVEIVADAHLGRIELDRKGSYTNLGYFALKPSEAA